MKLEHKPIERNESSAIGAIAVDDGRVKTALVVEDNYDEAMLVKSALQRCCFSVEVTDNGTTGLGLLLANDYDLAIVDLALPGIPGLEVISEARKRGRETPIVILSSNSTEDAILNGFGCNIEDYIPKYYTMKVFEAHIRAIMGRIERKKKCDIVTIWDTTLNRKNKTVTRKEQTIRLPPQLYALFELFVSQKGSVVTYETIYQEVYCGGGSKHAVNQAVRDLRQKLKVGNDEFIIENVRGVGYVIR